MSQRRNSDSYSGQFRRKQRINKRCVSRRNARKQMLAFERLEPRLAMAAGVLDPSFGVGGLLSTDIVNNSNDRGRDIAVQADGKIVAVGTVQLGTIGTPAIVRYHLDGSLDSTFDGDGIRLVNDIAVFQNDHGSTNAVIIQPDGRIVTAGQANWGGGVGMAITRFNTDGSLDTSFGYNGLSFFGGFHGHDGLPDWVNQASANDLMLDNLGRIVVAGWASVPNAVTGIANKDYAVARLNPNGSLDTSFSGDGKAYVEFGADNEGARAVDIDEAGRIVLVGVSGSPGHNEGPSHVTRFNSDGTLDTAFGVNGRWTSSWTGAFYGVSIDTSGYIVAAGGRPGGASVVRLNPNGSLDSSFNGSGESILSDGYYSDVQHDSVGRIVLLERNQVFRVRRLLPNGSVDSTFGSNGTGTADHPSGNAVAEGLAIQNDGKIVTIGEVQTQNFTSNDFALARFLGDNEAPTAVAGGPYTIDEGGNLQLDGSVSSDLEDGPALTYQWDLNYDGNTFDVDAVGVQPNVSFADNFSQRNIALRVTDSGDLSNIATSTLAVTNVAPVVGAITSSASLLSVNSVVNVSANFTDEGVLDSHTAEWDWGDGSTSAGIVTESGGTGSVNNSHVYSSAGVYTVKLAGTANDYE